MADARREFLFAWFEAFLAELLDQQRQHGILGPHIAATTRPHILTWEDAGWYVTLGKVRGDRGSVGVWLDRYLDPDGDYHLGAWYQSTAARVREVATVLGVDPAHHYRSRDRNAAGYLLRAAGGRELKRLKQLLVDDWGRSESYVGAYVASPRVQSPSEAIGPVLKQVCALAEGALSDTPTSGDDDLERATNSDTERYRELIERLARPQQVAFRAAVIRLHRGRCAITGCSDLAALEASHIVPVADDGTDDPDNGLLLRADLHNLFDAGLLTISSGPSPRVLLHESLVTGHYGDLQAKELVESLSAGQLGRIATRGKG